MSYFTSYFTTYFGGSSAVTPPAVVEERTAGGARWHPWHLRPRTKREADELADEIAALEQHIADERNVKREVVRIESKLREMPNLPRPARKAVRRALRLQTHIAFDHAETILRRLQEEEEEFAMLVSLALH